MCRDPKYKSLLARNFSLIIKKFLFASPEFFPGSADSDDSTFWAINDSRLWTRKSEINRTTFQLNLAPIFLPKTNKKFKFYAPNFIPPFGPNWWNSGLAAFVATKSTVEWGILTFSLLVFVCGDCGSVGRAVTSNSRGPRFEYSHRQNLILNIYCQLLMKRWK